MMVWLSSEKKIYCIRNYHPFQWNNIYYEIKCNNSIKLYKQKAKKAFTSKFCDLILLLKFAFQKWYSIIIIYLKVGVC